MIIAEQVETGNFMSFTHICGYMSVDKSTYCANMAMLLKILRSRRKRAGSAFTFLDSSAGGLENRQITMAYRLPA